MVNNTTYQTTEPTNSNISNWTSGWGNTSGITGWDYVGMVGGASGVYLGNGWVLTAGHVNLASGTYTLDGVTYTIVADSVTTTGTADIKLFRITSINGLPSLASLTINSSAPSVGTGVVMIGYGDGSNNTSETWGYNRVNLNNYSVTASGYTSTDFVSVYGSSGNAAEAVLGDSGGAAFTFNSSTGKWQLSGIINVVYTDGSTGFVQLSSYYSFITSTIATVPEPSSLVLLGFAGAAFSGLAWRRMRPSR